METLEKQLGLQQPSTAQSELSNVCKDAWHPLQGLRCWLGLKSRRGEPAGAVQVAVYITQLDGHFMVGGAHSARYAWCCTCL